MKDIHKHTHENLMFTNKVNQSIPWVGKGKDSIPLIKSLINVRV